MIPVATKGWRARQERARERMEQRRMTVAARISARAEQSNDKPRNSHELTVKHIGAGRWCVMRGEARMPGGPYHSREAAIAAAKGGL